MPRFYHRGVARRGRAQAAAARFAAAAACVRLDTSRRRQARRASPEGATHAESQARKWLVLAALSVGIVMALLDATILSIAVPSIVKGLNSSVTQVSWVLNGYNLGLTALFLAMGRIADRFGRRRVYVAGMIVFGGFSAACGLAPSIHWLIAFRVFQAIGAAGIVPVALAMLLAVFPRTQRGLAAGLYGALTSLAAALGPTLGGVLIHYGSWRWIFYVNLPLAALGVLVAWLLVPPQRPEAAAGRVDGPGIVLCAAGLFCLTLALIQSNSWGWASWRVLGLFVLAAAALALFAVRELRSAEPMIDLRLFRRRPFAAACLAITTVDIAMMGAAFLLVVFLVGVAGFNELRAAVAITPMPLCGLIVAPATGRLSARLGSRWVVVAGALLSAAGLTALGTLSIDASLAAVAWRTALIGLGFGLTLPTLTDAGMGVLPRGVAGVGAGALNTARQLGFVFGVAILVAVFSHTAQVAAHQAASQARALVRSQVLLPSDLRDKIIARIDKAGAIDVTNGVNAIRRMGNPAAGIAHPAPGSLLETLLKFAKTALTQIFKERFRSSFVWPFRTAAIAALLALPPAVWLPSRRRRREAGEPD